MYMILTERLISLSHLISSEKGALRRIRRRGGTRSDMLGRGRGIAWGGSALGSILERDAGRHTVCYVLR